MNRLCAVVVVALVTGAAFAYPAIGGGRGLFRVQNALVESEAGLTISFHAIGRNPKFPGSNDKAWVADLVAPELSYAPVTMKYFGMELFGSWGGVFQYPMDTLPGSDPLHKGFDMGLGDLKAGAKLSVPVLPVFKLGFGATYTFGNKDTSRGWLDPGALPTANDPAFAWTGMATFHFQELVSSAPNLLLNYGKVNDATLYGAGIELVARGFALFAEARSLQRPNSTGIFDTDSGEVRVTPGIAFGTSTSGVTFKGGYTFSFGPTAGQRASPNELLLGLVIATPFGKRVPAELGTIAGSVTDSRTGQPLAAKVNFPENPKLQPLASDSATGVFKIEKVPAGVVVVEVTAEGYHTQAVPINVTGSAVAQYQFGLKPLVTYGVIAGMVTDAASNRPLAAHIEFPGSDVAAIESDPGTGSFRIDNIPVGIYTVAASADGYFKSSQTVQVEENRVASPTFALKPLTTKAIITGKVSDKKTGEPLAARISFPGSDLAEVVTDSETGVYKTDVPVGSYAIKVASEGYIPQTAAMVIEENKPTIRDFELVKKGMAITLRGIYFDFNKATIKPESQPALADAAKILTDNPGIRVEIQGHTDAVGTDEYNQKLSEKRAWAVVNYLVQNSGIDAARLTAVGFGESKPIATNDTEDGRALNRRVEFVIVSAEGE